MVMGQLDTGLGGGGGGLGQSLEAALAWWREAGVDYAFSDAPLDWLAAAAPAPASKAVQSPAPPPTRAAPPVPEAAPIAADRTNWPAILADFAPWWLAEPSLAPRGLARVPPSGPANPALMVLVPMPAEDDDGALLSGKAGRLLDAMLAAFGVDPARVYRASALPART